MLDWFNKMLENYKHLRVFLKVNTLTSLYFDNRKKDMKSLLIVTIKIIYYENETIFSINSSHTYFSSMF